MKQLTALKQILKQDDREVFTKGYMRNGKQYVGCPYMYCAFNEKKDIPQHDENYIYPDFDRVTEGMKGHDVEFKLPTSAEIAQYIRDEKAKRNKYDRTIIHYVFPDGTTVNAKYLQIMIDAIPNAKAYGKYRYVEYKPYINGIYFTSDDGEGILMTIKRI